MDSKALTWACVGAVGAVALQYLLAGNPATLNAPPIAANARSRSTAAAAANGASVGGAAAAEEDEDDWEDIDTGDDDDDDDDEDDFRKGAIEHLSDDQGKAILARYPDEPCKMVLVVRNDLKKMKKGKTAAQCSHAAVSCYKVARRFQKKLVQVWEDYGVAKITLKIESDEEMEELWLKAKSKGLVAMYIRDAGRTQIAAGTRTVLGIGPAPVSLINEVTAHLKLMS